MMNKNNLFIPDEFYINRKIDLLNYQLNLKHLIYYQTKNDLKALSINLI